MKIENDKYYTPIEVANKCWDKVIELIGKDNITDVIEPSCGNGAFYHYPSMKPNMGIDIVPEIDNRDNFITQQDFEYTFLLDEPDRNLDITNIDSVYEILSHRKEMTQLITVIHNPVLIYKLSEVKGKNKINFIELTDGYLNDIKNVFEDLYSKVRG